MWLKNLSGNYLRETLPALATILESITVPHDPASLSRASIASLREISNHDVRAVCMLDVGPNQAHLVAPNAVSIAQAHFNPQAWFRAIYADASPVGFAMLEDWSQVTSRTPEPIHDTQSVMLWRFMIDHRYQKMGFGEQALRLIITHARTRANVTSLLLSFVPGENNPEPFYRRFGFVRTGEEDEGELIMCLRLTA